LSTSSSDDLLLVIGFALCVLGFFQGYWYWTFIGVLFFLSGCRAFRPEKDIKA